MKYFKARYITLILSVFTFVGCDFLDVDETADYSKQDILESYNRTKQLVTDVYSYLRHDFMNTSGAMLDAGSDDAIHVYETSAIQRFTNGTWSANRLVDDLWEHYFNGIRSANFYLIETEGQEFEDWKGSDNYDMWMKNFENFKYEVRFLRAFYNFELAKRYNRIPSVQEVLTLENVNNVQPVDFDSIVRFVVDECDSVAKYLPVTYTTTSDQETGRITKGAALALKSRVTLYAASPLFAGTDNKDKWKDAAKAAYQIIDNAAELNCRLTNYANLFIAGNNTNAEVFLARPMGESNTFESRNYPIGAQGGSTSTCPTENLVSCYEMKDGTIFDWNNPAMKENPYADRDPRLSFTIAYNDMVWPYDSKLEIWEGGANALPLNNATVTGYYLKKYLDNSIDFRPGKSSSGKHHNWVLFRYAEVFLNYAEAMVNAFDNPNYMDADFPMSALEAVNMVRDRADVKMPALPNTITASDFKQKLKNERRVEFAFEGHRFWDVRRWKDLDNTKTIYGVQVTKSGDDFNYSRVVVANREVSDKMYFYPISNVELNKNKNLVQNTGW